MNFWNRFLSCDLWTFDHEWEERTFDISTYLCILANKCWRNKTIVLTVKCERIDMSKRWFAEYIGLKTSDFTRQSNFNSVRALASAAEREIIFISFRTSEIISPIVPSLPSAPCRPSSCRRPRSLGRGLYGIASVRLSWIRHRTS